MKLFKFLAFYLALVVDAEEFEIPETPEIPMYHEDKYFGGISSKYEMFMQFSTAVYCPSTVTSTNWECGERCGGELAETVLTASALDSRTQGAGYVGYLTNRKLIVVVFRGSQSIQSAIQDLMIIKSEPDFQPKTYFRRSFSKRNVPSKLLVHSGFEGAYTPIRETIQQALLKLCQDESKSNFDIVFSGHSLGGAMAEIAAFDFHHRTNGKYSSRVSLITFGQPRVGNPAWAEHIRSLPFGNRAYRIVRNSDPIAQLPPRFLNYQHAGDQFEINKSDETFKCQTSGPAGESDECRDLIIRQNFVEHIVGYYGWWTYPWFC